MPFLTWPLWRKKNNLKIISKLQTLNTPHIITRTGVKFIGANTVCIGSCSLHHQSKRSFTLFIAHTMTCTGSNQCLIEVTQWFMITIFNRINREWQIVKRKFPYWFSGTAVTGRLIFTIPSLMQTASCPCGTRWYGEWEGGGAGLQSCLGTIFLPLTHFWPRAEKKKQEPHPLSPLPPQADVDPRGSTMWSCSESYFKVCSQVWVSWL